MEEKEHTLEDMLDALRPVATAETDKLNRIQMWRDALNAEPSETLKALKRTCPKCGKSNDGNKVKDFCPDCGTAYSATTIKCKKCNTENDFKFKYCTGCGAKLK